MKRAIIHDYLYVHGGAERTLAQVHAIWPDAPIHTLLHLPDQFPPAFNHMPIQTTWVNRLPATSRLARFYSLLQPIAFSGLHPNADTVISLASFGAKAVQPIRGGRHLCYCFTPPRFLWGLNRGTNLSGHVAPVQAIDAILIRWLRRWDRRAANRVTHFIAQSRYIESRIAQIYGRSSRAVVHPPVAVDRFLNQPDTAHGHAGGNDGYLFAVARFEAYKRLDLAILACRRLRMRLRIAGSGVDEARLRTLAGDDPNIQFLGAISDETVAHELAGCRAFLFPGEEDFGLTAVEAQACGKPVIAYGVGGALETVVAGVTGTFFSEPTADALADTLESFKSTDFNPDDCRTQALRFAPDRFRTALRHAITTLEGEPGE